MIKKIIGFFILAILITTILPVTGKINNNIEIIENKPQIELNTDWWSMFHHDLNHSGYTSSNGPLTNNTFWSYQTDGVVYSPSVIDNKVYFSGCGGVTCLNSTTGGFIWKYKTNACVGSSPAISNGKIYFGGDTKVYCLDTTTGKSIWNYTTGGFIASSPSVVNGKVYIGSDDKNVYCLDANTGSYIWKYITGYSIHFSSPAVDNGKVYIGSDKIYCLNAGTGSKIWDYTTGDAVGSSPAVANGKIYVGSNDNKIYCLNADTGLKIWDYTTGGDVDSSSAVSANDKIFFGSHDKKIYCLDITSGTLIWSYLTLDGIYSSPAVVDGKVYIGSGSVDGKIYCLGIENQPPNKPAITGPNSGKAGAALGYKFNAVDPDGNQVKYIIDWGDGKTDTTNLNPSGVDVTVTHTWSAKGDYTIKAHAQDQYGADGPESTKSVTMPQNRAISLNSLLMKVLERFPLLERILNL